jgi:hypothetical protein
VHDTVDAHERAIGECRVADVAMQELHAGRQRGRRAQVNLLLEAVEHDDVVALFEEPRDEVRADESGATGDEGFHAFDT